MVSHYILCPPHHIGNIHHAHYYNWTQLSQKHANTLKYNTFHSPSHCSVTSQLSQQHANTLKTIPSIVLVTTLLLQSFYYLNGLKQLLLLCFSVHSLTQFSFSVKFRCTQGFCSLHITCQPSSRIHQIWLNSSQA